LSFPSITIGRANDQHSIKPRTSDDITTRVRICLQNILKNEFGDAYEGDAGKKDPVAIMAMRNPLLAKYNPSDALARFKSEFKGYIDSDDPFDRDFREGETVRQWWIAVQRKPFGGVLGVGILHN
jgi:hypothetical protein